MATKPRIRIREAVEADTDIVNDLHFEAFDDNVMNQLMYPGGVSADTKAKCRARMFSNSAPKDDAKKKSETFLHVAELLPEDGPADGPGEIVAIAKWTLYREPRAEEEWKADEFTATTEIFGEGSNLEVINAFIGGMNQKQRDHTKGEAALCNLPYPLLPIRAPVLTPRPVLGVLACKPNRQRMGAGSALLKWGSDLADSLGIPCRLEASPAGYPLYRKFGYEDIDVSDLKVTETWGKVNTDGSDWGANNAVAIAGPAGEGVVRTVIMRRPPKKAAV